MSGIYSQGDISAARRLSGCGPTQTEGYSITAWASVRAGPWLAEGGRGCGWRGGQPRQGRPRAAVPRRSSSLELATKLGRAGTG